MATNLDLVDDAINRNANYEIKDGISSHTFTTEVHDVSQDSRQSDFLSSYTLENTMSHLSGDVDRWIYGSGTAIPTENTPVQGNRPNVMQRSTIVNSASLGCNNNSFWYLMTMIFPVFNIQNYNNWSACPSNFLSAAEVFLRQLSGLCGLARNQILRFAQDQLARDLFASAMDFVLIMYAMGFLVLSMYQASIIG